MNNFQMLASLQQTVTLRDHDGMQRELKGVLTNVVVEEHFYPKLLAAAGTTQQVTGVCLTYTMELMAFMALYESALDPATKSMLLLSHEDFFKALIPNAELAAVASAFYEQAMRNKR